MERDGNARCNGDENGKVGEIPGVLTGLRGNRAKSRSGSSSAPLPPPIDEEKRNSAKKDGGDDAWKYEIGEEQQWRAKCLEAECGDSDNPVRSVVGKSTALAACGRPTATEPRLGTNDDSGSLAVRANGGFIHSRVREIA
jgi:hypothetical protein